MKTETPSRLAIALLAAKKIGPTMQGMTWDQMRDCIDQASGSELDAWQLDKVTDAAVAARDKPMTGLVLTLKTALSRTIYALDKRRGRQTDWIAAECIKSALKRKDPFERLSGVRQALQAYPRLSAELVGETIELRENGKIIITVTPKARP